MNRFILDKVSDLNCEQFIQHNYEFTQKLLTVTNSSGIILSLDGKLDSTILLLLFAKFISKKIKVLIFTTNSAVSSDTSDAQSLAKDLKISYELIDTTSIQHAYQKITQSSINTSHTPVPIQITLLYHYAYALNYLVVNTGNYSDYLTSNTTQSLNDIADILPLHRLYKSQIMRLGKFLNIPQNILEKSNIPNLPSLPILDSRVGPTYEELDSILYCLESNLSSSEIYSCTEIPDYLISYIKILYENNKHKRQQGFKQEMTSNENL